MDTVSIIKPDDVAWKAYRDLRLEALREEPQAFGSPYQAMAQKPDAYWQGRLADAAEGRKSWLLFAKRNNRLIGMIGAFVEGEADIAGIISVYVTKDERGKGVAKALMTDILQAIRQNDTIRKVRIIVNVSQTPAVSLYKIFGFEIVKETEELSGDGKYYTAYVMEKLLNHLKTRVVADSNIVPDAQQR